MAKFKDYINFMEVMKSTENLPEDVFVVIEQGFSESIGIHYGKQDGEAYSDFDSSDGDPEMGFHEVNGVVEITPYKQIPNAWTVLHTKSVQGWGPLLYDIAIEYATEKGTGLVPDRRGISPEAISVWNKYAHNRPDVQSQPIPENLWIKNAYWNSRNTDVVNRLYTKQPVVLNQLKHSNKLIEKRW
jgi:hypothetical protein